MSKPNVNSTRKMGQNNTKSRVRVGMTNKMGTKTRRYGGTYGNTTTSKSGSREMEGYVTLENGKEVIFRFDFSISIIIL